MSDRLFAFEGYDPAKEGLREALHTTGNGYFATRGAAPESRADGVHYPATYVGGLYNRLETEIAGERIENESIVNLPNWLAFTFKVNDEPWFDLDSVDVLDYRQEFDVSRGVLTRRVRFRDGAGRTTAMTQRRFAHMLLPHLAGLQTTLLAEDWSGRVTFRSCIDGRVENCGVARYRDLAGRHLRVMEQGSDEGVVWLVAETVQSHWRIGEAVRTRAFTLGRQVELELQVIQEEGLIGQLATVEVAQHKAVTVDKVAAIYTSRDKAITEPGLDARQAAASAADFDDLLQSHVVTWEDAMQLFHMDVDGDDDDQLAVNVHVAHLLQVASENTIGMDVGVPARGLHGEAYRGHIFWDELFIFPFLSYRWPELTRSLLMYRYRRLPEARRNAAMSGYAGAMYPWQSGSNGREENQVIHLNPRSGRWLPDNTELQRHINIAIAYNVWQYYQISGDSSFLAFYGAEMLIEISRFWASAATYDHASDRYEIRGVMGPDEYHDSYPGETSPGLDNNAYTNVMVAWVLRRTLDAMDALTETSRQRLIDRFNVTSRELQLWEHMTRKMVVVFHEDGVISQFQGYVGLQEFDWDGYRAKYGDIQRLDRILESEGLSTNAFKVSKQADVLMLFYLLSSEELHEVFARLGYPLQPSQIPETIDYYMQRTSHGSTLSGVVHAWVLARRDASMSWEFFQSALDSDITDVQGGTTQEGIHLGAMAGSVDILQRAYTGLEPRGDVLYVNPALPEQLSFLEMRIRYRGQWLDLYIDHELLRIVSLGGPPGTVSVEVLGRRHQLCPDQTTEVRLDEPR